MTNSARKRLILLLILNIVLLLLNIWQLITVHRVLAEHTHAAAMKPCRQGMVLEPGESCSFNVEIPLHADPPDSGI